MKKITLYIATLLALTFAFVMPAAAQDDREFPGKVTILSTAADSLTVAGGIDVAGDADIADQLIVGGAGPHVIGGALETTAQVKVKGSFTSSGASTFGLDFASTLTPGAANGGVYGFLFRPTLVEYSSGTHPLLATLNIDPPVVTGGAATVTNAASVYISDAPSATVAGANYALWVDAGLSRFDGVIYVADGSAGASSLAFLNSPTSGLHRAGADEIGMSIAGTRRYLWRGTDGFTLHATSPLTWSSGVPGSDAIDLTLSRVSAGHARFTSTTDVTGLDLTNSAQSPILSLTSGLANAAARNWRVGTNVVAVGDFVLQRSASAGAAATTTVLKVYNDSIVEWTTPSYAISGAGPHAVGGATESVVQWKQQGTFGGSAGHKITTRLEPAANANVGLFHAAGTVAEAGSGTHSLLASVLIDSATVVSGAATITNTASLYVAGAMAPTVAGENYAVWSDAGINRFDGQMAFGGVSENYTYAYFTGTFTPTGAGAGGWGIRNSLTINARVGGDTAGLLNSPTIVEAASGTHTILAGAYLQPPTITGAGATVTNAATLYIEAAPSATVTGANYAIWADDGVSRFDGTIQAGGLITSVAAATLNVYAAADDLGLGSSSSRRIVLNSGTFGPSVDGSLPLGTSGERWSSGFFSTALVVGTNPSTTGAVRLSNAEFINTRNAANTANLTLIGANSSNIVQVGTDNGQGLTLYGIEISDPPAPSANAAVIYYRDNGSGKTQACARFPTGAVQCFATEP